MKRTLYFILLLLLLSCCTNNAIDERLGYVNELAMRNDMDSANIVMAEANPAELNEYNSLYCQLLSIKLRDKSYQDIAADTVIHDVIRYFEQQGNKDVLADAYYYGGRVCRMRGDAPQSLDYFQKAFETASEINHYIKGKASSQMGQLFFDCYLYDQAKYRFKDAVHYASLRGDSLSMMYDLRELGNIYKRIEVPDSALIYYKKGMLISQKICPFTIDGMEMRAALIDFYLYVKDYISAKQEYERIIPFLNENNMSEYVLKSLVNICIINKNYNDVEEYAHKLKLSESIHTRRFAYTILKNLAKSRKQSDKLYEYTLKYDECQDDININASREAIIYQNSLYNYSLHEKENLQLKRKQYRLYMAVLVIVIVLLIVICIMLFFVIWNRKLKNRIALQLVQLEKLKLTGSHSEILVSEDDSVQQLLATMRIKFEDITKGVKETQLSEIILQSKIYQKIYDCVHDTSDLFKTLSQDDWDLLDELVNSVYVDFRTNLVKPYPKISEQEYRICLLIKCKFGNSDIAKLTHKDKSAIAHARKRLFKKYFMYEGSALDFDLFISSL